MIHPVTLLTFVAFFGAGFYVFQTKEEVAKLDRDLRETRRQTEGERARTQVLAAEWARLNDQDRLRQLANTHLRDLQPMEAAQFQRLEDAQRRMPVALAFTPVPTGFQRRADAPTAPGEALIFTMATLRAQDAPPPPAQPLAPPMVVAQAAVAAPLSVAPVMGQVAAPGTAVVAPAASARPVVLAMAAPASRPAAAPPAPAAAPRAAPQLSASVIPSTPRPTQPRPAQLALASPVAYTPPAPMGGSMLGGTISALPPPVPFQR